MPARNFNFILAIVIVSLACYLKAERTRYAGPVGDALFMIDRYYVDPVDGQKLVESAMQSIVGNLDPYSNYIDQRSFGHFQDLLQQRFAGIGIVIEKPKDLEYVRVISPLLGTPAFKAGFRPGDLIVQVNGDDMRGLDISAVSDKLRGPENTSVAIRLQRGKDRFIDVTVSRASISVDSVLGDHRDSDNKWVFAIKEHPEIAYIRVTTFGEQTVDELADVLNRLDNQFAALIVDLRQNEGGLLNAAEDIADMFLNEGVIVSTRGRDRSVKQTERLATRGTLVDADKPMIMLVDGDSASASEIVAACLQDHKRALIAGRRSFGKGTVQNVLPLELGKSALKLTTARYYRPSEKNIHRVEGATEEDEWGVKPEPFLDIELSLREQIRALMRLKNATYPVLPPEPGFEDVASDEASGEKENADPDPSDSQSAEPDNATEDAEPNASSEDNETEEEYDPIDDLPLDDLRRDPQLKGAVDYLLNQLKASVPKQAAA